MASGIGKGDVKDKLNRIIFHIAYRAAKHANFVGPFKSAYEIQREVLERFARREK